MSTHPDSYKQIRESTEVLEKIRRMEAEATSRTKHYIPKDKVGGIQALLRNGDILGITTDFEGLDTSHTGILVKEGEKVRLMHAPLAGMKVELTDSTLPEYLERNKRQTGIIVARPLEVS